MCGIAGIVAVDPCRSVSADPMRAMVRCLRHRGPDDEGVYSAPGVVLGHARLSVIDVAGGHQPLRGQRETTHAVVNGEIYNYRELREELRRAGGTFRTASDSEVAAHAWDVWGVDALRRFDGMFALAVWDGRRRQLVLARDRLGEKPLFYAEADGLLVFASELSAVLSHPAVNAEIDLCSLREYLALEYVPAPRSLVKGVHKLEPGSFLTLRDGVLSTERYWSLAAGPATETRSYADSVSQLRVRLETAVESRLVSDVPLGVFLSGGVDSSAVAALAARHGALDTFSIGFEERSFDESIHARTVAAHIGSRHHERVVEAGEMANLVPSLADVLDEPIGDASILPTMVLSRFAREHVTVALGGDGGDELFAGYPMHQARRFATVLGVVPAGAVRLAARVSAALPVSHANFSFGFRAATFLRGALQPAPRDHATWMSSFPPRSQESLLREDVMRAAIQCDPYAVHETVWRTSAGAEPLARACHLDAMTYLPNDILTKVDRASMAVALEVRSPFLARDVVEFAFSLPDRFRMRGLSGKRVLRDAVRDLLPPAILARPKKGFGMPVAAWLNGSLKALLHDLLSRDSVLAAGLFDPAAVQRLLDEHGRCVRDHRKPLWTLLVLELWRRHHLVELRGAGRSS